ncbi:integrin alpha-6-like isoform X2 [Branchiostoma floridae]|uniref:Integrin alpha-6-like isoform X2 n=2 Tax=Branchiostoma floridae TaxID=7739 RepID=A0A9J7N4C6_BRAFL|nr:integrin alpha-6-like isoform X2 [Branchiostoma floridae]
MGRMGSTLPSLFCVFLWILPLTLGFNYETRIPLVKEGPQNSYFGFSVAQHQITADGSDPFTVTDNVLLAGAPMDDNIYQQNTIQPGALYRCPMSTRVNDCIQLRVDDTDASSKENKTLQWLGVNVETMNNVGGKVLTCAHRYMSVPNRDASWGLGKCFQLTNQLGLDDTHSSQGQWTPCQGYGDGHQEYGYCQAGTAGGFSEDDKDVIFGAPGSYYWMGVLFATDVTDQSSDLNMYKSPEDLEVAGVPRNSYLATQIPRNSYLGWAITSGRFLAKNRTDYVSGAPRANSRGAVLFFGKEAGKFVTRLVLKSEWLASSFGFSVASVDLNFDTWPDLAVGAPFYFDAKNTKVGGAVFIYMNDQRGMKNVEPIKLLGPTDSLFGFALANAGDVDRDGYYDLAVGAPYDEGGMGAVYLYRGDKNAGIVRKPSQKIVPTDFPTPFASIQTFGYSLSGGRDMDDNGYSDLLVGAYQTANIVLLRARPVVTVEATFEGPSTIDPNDFSSGSACRIGRNSSFICFDVTVKLTYTSRAREVNDRITGETVVVPEYFDRFTVDYKLQAEKTRLDANLNSRVFFNQRLDQNTFEGQLRLRNGRTQERKIKVYVKRDVRDYLRPIPLELNYDLPQNTPSMPNPGRPVTNLINFPILNMAVGNKRDLEVHFQKDCGDDQNCNSNMLLSARFMLPGSPPTYSLGSPDELSIEVTAQNFDEPAYEAALLVVVPESLSLVGVTSVKEEETKTSCSPREGNETYIDCEVGNPLRELQKFLLRFETRNIGTDEPELEVSMELTTTSNETNTEDDRVTIVAKVIVEVDLTVSGKSKPEQVFFGGQSKGESEMEYLEDIGTPLSHTFVVRNIGTGDVPKAVVSIDWPYEILNTPLHTNGKWLLYLTDIAVVGNAECRPPPGIINPLSLESRRPINYKPVSSTTARDRYQVRVTDRARRSLTDNYAHGMQTFMRRARETNIGELLGTKSSRESKILDCKKGTARCAVINCTIDLLAKNKDVVITFQARLWNSTFLQEYREVKEVDIVSHATVRMLPTRLSVVEANPENDKTAVSTRAFPDFDLQKEAPGVPLWIIIVAVVGGLLLLVLLILCLWKCGFFQRTKLKEQRAVKRKAHSAYYDQVPQQVKA